MRKFWTSQEKELLRMYYPDNRSVDILHLFPDRTATTISQHANVMGLKKKRSFYEKSVIGTYFQRK